MNVYAESSAILSWLLAEARASRVGAQQATAELVLASCLTPIECDRALIRALAMNLLPEAAAAQRRAALTRTAEHWVIFDLETEVMERARRPFPGEPIRTLDAIHLGTAVVVGALVSGLAVLSLDDRIRRAATQMGLHVLPGEGP